MAEETQMKAEEVVVVETKKTAIEKDAPPSVPEEALNKHEFTAPPPAAKEEEKKAEIQEAFALAEEKPIVVEETPILTITEEPPKTEASKVAEPVLVSDMVEEKKEAPSKKPGEVTPLASAPEVEELADVVVTEVVEKITYVDDDGTKTVEAIEETIIAVSAPAAPAEETAAASPKKEGEVEAAAAATAPPVETKQEEITNVAALPPPLEEVSIWGIPLLADERSDVVLLKFLHARDFKVKDAFTMIKNTVAWRKEFGIETLLEEDLGLAAQIDKQALEIDRFILLQNEILRSALHEQRNQQMATLLKKMESKALSLLKRKDEDIVRAAKRTIELMLEKGRNGEPNLAKSR
ncbi:patellin-1-like [Telopea speciosissima]|uniref:patellin-1-like n=1 Tax=Telopea speciosissima TaxID=54955 RepID=UPI001CC6EFA4|nr:patellin-1-like [Telopea speciosissima]